MTTTPLSIGALAPDIALQTTDGQSVRLAQFWQHEPVVLFFVRHVGCVFALADRTTRSTIWMVGGAGALAALAFTMLRRSPDEAAGMSGRGRG